LCIDDAKADQIYNHYYGYHCKLVPDTVSEEYEAPVLRFCDSDTDSDSDCIRIGNKHNKIIPNNKWDQTDSGSHFTDPNCDPRFSSCDTDSNEALSNTDTETVSTVSSRDFGQKAPKFKGTLQEKYARKYGVAISSSSESFEYYYGYEPNPFDSRSYLTGSSRTSYPVDSCDPDDVGCSSSATDPESEVYAVPSESTQTFYPVNGTSNSSDDNSEGSHSHNDSSSESSTGTEGGDLSESLCASVVIQDVGTGDVIGSLRMESPAHGYFVGQTKVTANVKGLIPDLDSNFHVHAFTPEFAPCGTGFPVVFFD
jgi:hypothetical protein